MANRTLLDDPVTQLNTGCGADPYTISKQQSEALVCLLEKSLKVMQPSYPQDCHKYVHL